MTEQEALQRYASEGDPDAFRWLIGEHQAMVYGACRRVLHQTADVEDAVQETFLKLARHASTIRVDLKSWLYRTAVNSSLDLIRRTKRAPQSREDVDASGHALEPRELAEWREVRQVLDVCILELDEADQRVIVDYYFLGRTQSDIAADMGVSQPAIQQRLKLSIGRLRAKLREHGVSAPSVVLIALLTSESVTAMSVPSQVTAELGRIGVAGHGVPVGAKAPAIAASGATWVAAVAAAVVIAVAGWMVFAPPAGPSASNTPSTATGTQAGDADSVLAASADAPPRPVLSTSPPDTTPPDTESVDNAGAGSGAEADRAAEADESLPAVMNAESLAERIRQHDSRIRRISLKYDVKLTDGELFGIHGEYRRDGTHVWLQQRMLGGGDGVPSNIIWASDGERRGLTTMSKTGRIERFHLEPEDPSIGSSSHQPGGLAGRYVWRQSLVFLLENGVLKVTPQPVDLEGHLVYFAASDVGEIPSGCFAFHVKVWLDPKKGYLPRRVEEYVLDHNRNVVFRHTLDAYSYDKADKNAWLAMQADIKTEQLAGGRLALSAHSRVEVTKAQVNRHAPSDLEHDMAYLGALAHVRSRSGRDENKSPGYGVGRVTRPGEGLSMGSGLFAP